MTVNFYYTGDDPATLVKALTSISSAECQIKENSSILRPTIIVRYDTWQTLVSNNCNYCQIPSFGNRYYFLGNPVITTGSRVELEGNVDVLQSNYVELLNCEGYIQRGGRPADWNSYLPDNSVPVKTTERVINVQFDSTPFNIVDVGAVDANQSQNYLLTVVGGEI